MLNGASSWSHPEAGEATQNDVTDQRRIPPAVRILVVEDDPIVGADIGLSLSEAGFDLIGIAHSSRQFFEIVQQSAPPPGCVLLDVHLMHEASTEVKEHLEHMGIPYVVVTGMAEDTVREMGYRGPILSKPFGETELIETVQAITLPGTVFATG